MKKFLALLMTLVMAVSFVVTLSVSSSAKVDWVEETYNLQSELDAFGTHAAGDDFKLSAEPQFGGVWAYEWFDVTNSTFAPMGVYVNRSLGNEGSNNGWSNYYSPYAECLYDADEPANYCMVMSNGKQMHPGTGTGPVITYIAPASGTISFYAEIFPYSNAANGNLSTNDANGNKGNHVYLYVNDTKVWPTTEEDSIMFADTHTAENPMKVDVTAFNVKAGDRVRMVMTARAGDKGGKGCTLAAQPVVTWHSTSDGTPVGNPNGNPPEGILSSDLKDTSAKISWTAAKNAAGYNIYLDGKKVNSSPIAATEYVLEGLTERTLYEFTITTVTTSGNESAPSAAQSFRTKKGATTTTTTSTSTVTSTVTSTEDVPSVTDTTTDVVTNEGSVTDSEVDASTESNVASTKTSSKTSSKKTSSTKTTASDDSGFPLWIIIVIAAVVVLAVAAVVVFLVLKKKPAEEAAIEGEVAEEAAEAVEGEVAEEAAEDAPEAPTEE